MTPRERRRLEREAMLAEIRAAGLCEWFALCENQATMKHYHPILGDVPICARCNSKVEEMKR